MGVAGSSPAGGFQKNYFLNDFFEKNTCKLFDNLLYFNHLIPA
ncbi:hypothetical protein RR47_GL002006 [Enterococcus columbae DSM 7374 = ATCC 51263]|nr:hypothetical protein RR47_GL002006 [Enterococcus columbae DSM 7374 = ATCC 51263]